ncbi:MAG: Uma2 family endonuclease [Saprospiraceae bacterium]|nr:Uma2 family endonuclease [Saprospiraceae bacterium]
MSLARRVLPNYTYEDYCQWQGEWELIDGIPHAMTPAPSPRHQLITANLIFQLRIALDEANQCNCRVYDPLDIRVNKHTVLRPDVLIL